VPIKLSATFLNVRRLPRRRLAEGGLRVERLL